MSRVSVILISFALLVGLGVLLRSAGIAPASIETYVAPERKDQINRAFEKLDLQIGELGFSFIAASAIDENAVFKDSTGQLTLVVKGGSYLDGRYKLVQVADSQVVLRDRNDQSLIILDSKQAGFESQITRISSTPPEQKIKGFEVSVPVKAE